MVHSQIFQVRFWSMDVSSKFTLIDARISVKQAIESVPLRVTGYHPVHFSTVKHIDGNIIELTGIPIIQINQQFVL